ncbi:uracil-DNA glycosylase [Enterococcus raffinosus]|uniref:uracil-DNA glycosylase n=1 Tax=Enterococcus raffinosus TaxID=71452 RepID=UPI000763D522|nr:uracil-DNA glycosylase [Enterococcus raffinosus]MDT2571582.1 uracil-DNA glycosylase [Enterococcus raffinosus]OJG82900.1 uracil-DNA glycosylase, family 4 [Enterococcus raffinosus]QXJ58570.1 uracil-DNA glycosylase [Enterococcus raffinosus]GMS56647.1 uracil-DNA glycosylase [Enterococcus raffinosus]
MEYPKELVALVAERSKDFQLEGFIAGQGPTHPKLMLVGEAPGRKEVVNHIPFSGAAGKELIQAMASIGLTRENTYITSAVRSRPYKIIERINKRTKESETVYPNRTPNKKEILAHAPILDYELVSVQPTIIATLGNIGLQRLLGPKWQISESHGKIYHGPVLELNNELNQYQPSKEEYTVVPLFHPAAIFYNRSLSEKIKDDWLTLGKLLEKEEI